MTNYFCFFWYGYCRNGIRIDGGKTQKFLWKPRSGFSKFKRLIQVPLHVYVYDVSIPKIYLSWLCIKIWWFLLRVFLLFLKFYQIKAKEPFMMPDCLVSTEKTMMKWVLFIYYSLSLQFLFFFLLVFFSFCIRILTLLKKTLEQGFCDFMQEMVCLMQREITQVFFVFPDDHFPVLKLINNELIVLEGKTIIPKSRI